MAAARAAAGIRASDALLAAAGVYKPMWKYPLGVLRKDLSAHLSFGLGTGVAFHALNRCTTQGSNG